MNLLIINGSRNPLGQTASAAAALAEGAVNGGANLDVVFVPELKIERCRHCDMQGWGLCRSEKRCVIEDDFAALLERVRQADAVAFATPVYYSDLSESLRAFLDRLRRVAPHGDGIKDKPVIGICVAGGGGGGAPRCARNMEYILTTCGFDVVDVIPVRRQNLQAKLEVMRSTGKWLASN